MTTVTKRTLRNITKREGPYPYAWSSSALREWGDAIVYDRLNAGTKINYVPLGDGVSALTWKDE